VSLAVIILALIAVPPVRAQIIQWIRIGVVEIFQVEPTPAPVPTAAPADAPSGAPIASTLPTLTPEPTPTALLSPLDLDGETTLEELRAEGLAFPVRLPAYPDDLGEPEKVFLQNAGGPVVILVWYDEGTTRDIRLVLYELGPTARGYEKIKPLVVEETTVNGQPAVWTVGPYMLKARNGDMRVYRLVEGATLIWVENEITYRLEIDLPLDEARKIAESLQE
jgi:hypothetical protein